MKMPHIHTAQAQINHEQEKKKKKTEQTKRLHDSHCLVNVKGENTSLFVRLIAKEQPKHAQYTRIARNVWLHEDAQSPCQNHMSRSMGFPTMWYVRPAKPQISLRICAAWSEPLQVAVIFYEY